MNIQPIKTPFNQPPTPEPLVSGKSFVRIIALGIIGVHNSAGGGLPSRAKIAVDSHQQ